MIDVYVPNGMRDERSKVNALEVAAIVEEIKNIVADPSMAGRSIETRHLKNSNDLKFKVLHHFAKPMPVQNQTNNPIELCESHFERDVFSKLTASIILVALS